MAEITGAAPTIEEGLLSKIRGSQAAAIPAEAGPSAAAPAMDMKSLLKQMQGAPAAFAAEVAPYQDQLSASTTKIEEMRKKQALERAPMLKQIKDKSAETTKEYKPGELPDFKPPQMDPKELGDTMSLIMAVSAMSGLLTRQPLTAALNSFSQGVHGLVQGNQEVYKRSLDTFKTSFEKAKTQNDEQYRQVQDARIKHKNDIQGLMDQMTLLSAEHQDAVQTEMLRRGDLTSAINLIEKRHASMDKSMNNVARIVETAKRDEQAHLDRKAALENKGFEIFQDADKNLVRINKATGKPEVIEGSQGLTKMAPTGTISAVAKQENKFRNDYEKEIKPVKEFEFTINKVRSALLANSPLGRVEATQMLSELSKGARGTNMQVAMTRNFGDLPTRLAGMVELFATGMWDEKQKKQVVDLLDSMQKTVVEPEKQQSREKYIYLAKENNLNPAHVVYGREGAAPDTPGPVDPDAFLDKFLKAKPPGG